MPAHPHEFIDEVKARTDIVEIIGADIALRPCGIAMKGLSPFNTESDPSFVVWPKSQRWHDYSKGGNRGGDVIDYVMERQGLSFPEALNQLAQRAGLQRPDQDQKDFAAEMARVAERREIEKILTQAAAYYHRVLPAKIRRELYLEHYGFTDDTVDQLQLGWAVDHLHNQFGLHRSVVLKTGLIVQTRMGGVRDFFQNRIVFPYWKGGRVVYFIARRTQYSDDVEWEKGESSPCPS